MEAVQPVIKSIGELPRAEYPVKILQFGAGNFLRGFADWMIQEANAKAGFHAGVCIVQSISTSDVLARQGGVYTVLLKGIHEEEFVSKRYKIDVVQRIVNPTRDFDAYLAEGLNPDLQIILSNTTEAGIAFSPQDVSFASMAATFPGKLTQLLYHRFRHGMESNLVVLPTELIERNGAVLKGCILKYCQLWSLPPEFTNWINTHITFCSTLVDRIVSGFPDRPPKSVYQELGYKDDLVVEGEWFHLWVIEGPRWISEVLPFKKAGLNVIYANDLAPYRLRKVRILNGAHTCMACIGSMAGLKTVREAIDHPVVGNYLRRLIYDDICVFIPGDLAELEKYAEVVINRFRNPSIEHQLHQISFNSFSKFVVRVLPSITAQIDKNGFASPRLTYALAAFFYFYRGAMAVKDNEDFINQMRGYWQSAADSPEGFEQLCRTVLSRADWWGEDLSSVAHLAERTAGFMMAIHRQGIVESLKATIK